MILACCRSSGWKRSRKSKEAESARRMSAAEQRQRKSRAAQSVVKQREAELQSVSNATRSRSLSQRGAVSEQQLDDDRAWRQKAHVRRRNPQSGAGLCRQKPQLKPLAPASFRRKPRRSQRQATERRIAADIDDSELESPARWSQYRVAEPGEASGGRVLNMVDLSDSSHDVLLAHRTEASAY